MVNATVLNVVMITRPDNENLIDISGVFSYSGRLKSIHRQKNVVNQIKKSGVR